MTEYENKLLYDYRVNYAIVASCSSCEYGILVEDSLQCKLAKYSYTYLDNVTRKETIWDHNASVSSLGVCDCYEKRT